jgi:hypothetical protein
MYLQIDAVLTNNPEKYLALRDHVPTERDQPENWPFKYRWTLFLWNWLGFIMMSLLVWRTSGRQGWKEKLNNVVERVVEDSISEKHEHRE